MSASSTTLMLPDAVEYGIAIVAPSHCKENDGIRLCGEYKVLYTEESVPRQATLMPKHIALVATRGGDYTAIKPFSDMVVFDDDVKEDDEYASGHFNLNVSEHIPFNGPGDYYILCSLGTYLSNIVKVTVE